MNPTHSRLLAPFVDQRTVLLTTFKRDGTGVGTAVSIAVEGDHAYVRTFHTAGKAKRLRNNPEVEVAPSTVAGKATGPAVHARARLLDGAEARHAATLLAGKNKILQGFLVPTFHRLRGFQTLHYELTPVAPD
jgi:PPOX class probable F420-dependent enzyme